MEETYKTLRFMVIFVVCVRFPTRSPSLYAFRLSVSTVLYLKVILNLQSSSRVETKGCNVSVRVDAAHAMFVYHRCVCVELKSGFCSLVCTYLVCVIFEQDNLTAFLRGCEELGLKGSQLFDPGDLQDTSTRPTAKYDSDFSCVPFNTFSFLFNLL